MSYEGDARRYHQAIWEMRDGDPDGAPVPWWRIAEHLDLSTSRLSQIRLAAQRIGLAVKDRATGRVTWRARSKSLVGQPRNRASTPHPAPADQDAATTPSSTSTVVPPSSITVTVTVVSPPPSQTVSEGEFAAAVNRPAPLPGSLPMSTV